MCIRDRVYILAYTKKTISISLSNPATVFPLSASLKFYSPRETGAENDSSGWIRIFRLRYRGALYSKNLPPLCSRAINTIRKLFSARRIFHEAKAKARASCDSYSIGRASSSAVRVATSLFIILPR